MIELIIFPQRGIGPFVLGSSREDVIRMVGAPDSIELAQPLLQNDRKEDWHFSRFSITLSFAEDDDWKLASLTAKANNCVLNGVRFIGQPVSKIQELCVFAGITDLVADGDYDEFGAAYSSKAFTLMFWIAESHIFNITVFPEYDNSGSAPHWPHVER